MRINTYASADSLIDEPPYTVFRRKRLGYTHAVIGNNRRAIAWARSSAAAGNALRRIAA